jgi:predicted phosphodiesterase
MKTNKVSITHISDTHEQHDALSLAPGDILVCTGDITYHGEPFQIQRFGVWMAEQPFKHKVLVAGNHDLLFEKNKAKAIELLPSSIIYLQNSSVELEGLHIHGAPHQPWFYDWAFNVNRGRDIQVYWDMIPDETNVLLTHGPPAGIGDMTPRGEAVGCANLADTIDQRLKNLMFHGFGHIHHGHGLYRRHGVIYSNGSICNERYKPVNPPQVVELEVPVKEEASEPQPG